MNSETRLDRVVQSMLSWTSGATAIAIAVVSYGGLGLALPVVTHAPILLFVALNFLGATIATVICSSWLIVRFLATLRRSLLEWTSDLRKLNAREFEQMVGEMYRRDGWRVQETGVTDKPDGNIDLELTRDGVRRIVQCKRWESWNVGVDEIRRFLGTLTREHLPPSSGIFVTLSEFGDQARLEAIQSGLVILNGSELYERIESVRRPEPCPICEEPMVIGKSQFGWWLRCRSKGCIGKRDLSDDAGLAIKMLLSHRS